MASNNFCDPPTYSALENDFYLKWAGTATRGNILVHNKSNHEEKEEEKNFNANTFL